MCRLFALISDREASVELSDLMVPFRAQSKEHPHGWGIGWYSNGSPVLIKSPLCATQDNGFMTASLQVRSKISLAHIRYGTIGIRNENNTHPFSFGEWMFAHNGTICSKPDLRYQMPERYRERLLGTTDSEELFHFLLYHIDQNGGFVNGVRSAVEEIMSDRNEGTTSFNFVMSDGKKLYACHKSFKELDFYSLNCLERKKSDAHPSSSIVISSSPLTKGEWRAVENGTILEISMDDSKLNIRQHGL